MFEVAWRNRHFKTNDFGLGGLLSPENIKRLLRKSGTKVSMGSMNMDGKFPALGIASHHGSMAAAATIPLPDLSRSAIAPGYPNSTQLPAALGLPMIGYVGGPYVFPNASLPCLFSDNAHSSCSVLSNDSFASFPSIDSHRYCHMYQLE